METLKNINEVLQMIYLICAGPVLVYIAIKGLGQIKAARENTKTSKENSLIQSKREAYRLTGEQCRYFAESILPLFSKIDKEIEERNCNFFKKFEILLDSKQLSVKPKEPLLQQDFASLAEIKDIPELLNKLEGFSMYFTSGVADETLGFITAGRGYCTLVEKIIPLMAPRFKKGYFQHIAMLYVIWKNRCKTEDIKKQQKELEEQLAKTSSFDIPPVGYKKNCM